LRKEVRKGEKLSGRRVERTGKKKKQRGSKKGGGSSSGKGQCARRTIDLGEREIEKKKKALMEGPNPEVIKETLATCIGVRTGGERVCNWSVQFATRGGEKGERRQHEKKNDAFKKKVPPGGVS